jgi:hypothetical protein
MATILQFPGGWSSWGLGAGGEGEDALTVTVPWDPVSPEWTAVPRGTAATPEPWLVPSDATGLVASGDATTAFSVITPVTLEGLVDPLSDPNPPPIFSYYEVPEIWEPDPFSAGPGDVRFCPPADFDLARDSAAMVAEAMRFFDEPRHHHIYLRRIQILFERAEDIPTGWVGAISVLQALADHHRVILTVSHRKALPQDDHFEIRPTGVPPHELEIDGRPPTPRYDHTRPAPAGVSPCTDADAWVLEGHYTAFPEAREVLALLDASAAEICDLVLACTADDGREDAAAAFSIAFSSAHRSLHLLIRRLELPFGNDGQRRWAFIERVRAYARVAGIGLGTAFDHAFVGVNTLTDAGLTGGVDRHHVLQDIAELPLVQAVQVLLTLQRFEEVPPETLSHHEKMGLLNWLANIVPASVSLMETLAEILVVVILGGIEGWC